MCIACFLDKGVTVSQSEFENCWESNPHGGGFAWIGEDKKFHHFKSLDFDEFRKEWIKVDEVVKDHTPRLLHFRIRSQGDISIENCHPFFPNPNIALIHNGTIMATRDDSKLSDTRIFAEEWLAGLPSNWMYNQSIVNLVGHTIGSNKIALLDTKGEHIIFNKKSWSEDNGRLFSNQDFKWRRPKSSPTTSTNYPYASWQGGSARLSNKQSSARGTHWCPVCCFSWSAAKFTPNLGICDACLADARKFGKENQLTDKEAVAVFLTVAGKHPSEEWILQNRQIADKIKEIEKKPQGNTTTIVKEPVIVPSDDMKKKIWDDSRAEFIGHGGYLPSNITGKLEISEAYIG